MQLLSLLVFAAIHSFHSCEGKGLKVYNNVTEKQYYSLPSVFALDDFDACKTESPTLYCAATIKLHPADATNVSDAWRIMEELLDTPRTYRHNKLRHGICLPTSCPEIPSEYYAAGNGTKELKRALSSHYTRKYQHLGFKANVIKMFCQNEKRSYEVDYLDHLYWMVIRVILLVLALGTGYDIFKRYTAHKDGIVGRVLIAFSVVRNWERLTATNENDLTLALMPFQGVRVWNTIFVLMCHTVLVNLFGPVLNTKWTEDTSLDPLNMFIANGSLIIQTYFLTSAWLLAFSLCSMRGMNLKQMIFVFVNRYFRLAPLILLSVGFSATWLRHAGHGPVWNHYCGDEFTNCRNNWWTTMLFINNYYKSNEMCMQQTWYTACEMQCFIAGLFIMMAVIKNPKHANKIFGTCIVLGLALNVWHNYYMNYDIVYRAYAETYYTVYLEMKEFNDTFVAGHTAFPTYVQGLVYGYYFYKYREEKRKIVLSTKKYVVWLFFMFTIPLTTVLIAAHFYTDGFECTRLQAALYQGLSRYVFATSIGHTMFLFVFGLGGYMRPAITWRGFQVLARVTFSVFLTHVWVMRLRYGVLRTPTYLNHYNLFGNIFGDIVCSTIVGFLTCLLVEMPISALQKIILSPPQKPAQEDKTK